MDAPNSPRHLQPGLHEEDLNDAAGSDSLALAMSEATPTSSRRPAPRSSRKRASPKAAWSLARPRRSTCRSTARPPAASASARSSRTSGCSGSPGCSRSSRSSPAGCERRHRDRRGGRRRGPPARPDHRLRYRLEPGGERLLHGVRGQPRAHPHRRQGQPAPRDSAPSAGATAATRTRSSTGSCPAASRAHSPSTRYEETSTDSKGNRQTTYYHFTVAVSQLPGDCAVPLRACASAPLGLPVHGQARRTCFAPASASRSSPTVADKKFEIFTGKTRRYDQGAAASSPPCSSAGSAEDAHKGLAFELNAGAFVANSRAT